MVSSTLWSMSDGNGLSATMFFLNIVRKGPVHRNPDILKTEPFCPFFFKKCAWTNSVYQSFPPGGDGGEGISKKIGGSVRLPV